MTEETQAKLSVRVSEDGLRVLVDCSSPGDDYEGFFKRLEQEIEALGLRDRIDKVALDDWLARRAQEELPVRDGVLLEGRAPVPPVHGRIEWAGPFFDSGYIIDNETGAIDYRQHAAQLSVEAGQLLATVHPPRKGVDGENVFGKALRVPSPASARIHAGQNVSRSHGGREFHATMGGRIRWASRMLSVDQVYRIPGSIGLATGHVRHNGAVVIANDVEAGARVEADGDIEIKQVLEPADVVCGGSLTVRGGVTGSAGREVRVAGSVQARFLLEADVEAGADVIVEREIVRCVVKTAGAVVMPCGRIVGGRVTALDGIQAAQAGSAASVPTELYVGEDFRLGEHLAGINKNLAGFKEQLSKIEPVLAPVLHKMDSLPPDKAEAIKSLVAQTEKLKEAIKQSGRQAEAIQMESRPQGRPEVVIRDVIFPETVICIQQERLRIQEEVRGPVRAVYSDGQIRLIRMS